MNPLVCISMQRWKLRGESTQTSFTVIIMLSCCHHRHRYFVLGAIYISSSFYFTHACNANASRQLPCDDLLYHCQCMHLVRKHFNQKVFHLVKSAIKSYKLNLFINKCTSRHAVAPKHKIDSHLVDLYTAALLEQ